MPPRRGAPGAASQSTDPLGQHWGFTARFLDEETGLFYYRARYYDSTLGRFVQRDPLGYSDGPSLLEYASSSPSVVIDPTGLRDDPSGDGSSSGKTLVPGDQFPWLPTDPNYYPDDGDAGTTGEDLTKGAVTGAVGALVFGALMGTLFRQGLGHACRVALAGSGAGIAVVLVLELFWRLSRTDPSSRSMQHRRGTGACARRAHRRSLASPGLE